MESENIMNYETCAGSVPPSIAGDTLWKAEPLIMVPDQRGTALREDSPTYQVHTEILCPEHRPSADELAILLHTVPVP